MVELKLALDGLKAFGVLVVGLVAALAGRSFYGWLARAQRFDAELDTFGLARRLPIGSSLPGTLGLPRLPRLSRRDVRSDGLLLAGKAALDGVVSGTTALLAPLAVLAAPLESERGRAFFSTLLVGQALDELVDLYA